MGSETGMVLIYIFLLSFTAQVLKVCRTNGPTACSKTLATEGVSEKLEKGEKNR